MSISVKLLIGLLTLTLATIVTGFLAYGSIQAVGAIAIEIYDKPLMAINYARATETEFGKLRLALARQSEVAREDIEDRLGEIADNIEVVVERALSDDSRALAEETSADIEKLAGLTGQLLDGEAVDPEAFAAAGDAIQDALTGLVELTAAEGFEYRLRAEELVEQKKTETIALAATCLILALMITLVLSQIIVRPLKRVISVLEELIRGDLTAEFTTRSSDEVGKLARVLMAFKSAVLETRRLAEEQAELKIQAEIGRLQAFSKLADDFEHRVSAAVEAYSASAGQLNRSADDMGASADETRRLATSTRAASSVAADNVTAVAAGTEELSSSVAEIDGKVGQSASIAGEAVQKIEQTNAVVESLSNAANEIGDVVELISDIAEQTNLLALNATIEAARAGDAGKGFAVVASEVKSLANQTAGATDKIATKIADIRSVTTNAVDAIRGIGKVVRDIHEIAGSIAGTVESQSAATKDIALRLSEVSQGTSDVAENASQVAVNAERTGETARRMLEDAKRLADESADLKSQLDRFLTQIRSGLASDDTSSVRIGALEGVCRLESGEAPCRIVELSASGARLELSEPIELPRLFRLEISGFGETAVRKLWSEDRVVGCHFPSYHEQAERLARFLAEIEPAAAEAA